MYNENGILADPDEVRTVIDQADVFTVAFRCFAERLFVDSRSDYQTRPFITLVEPVDSVQERMFWLGQERPTLGMPKRFAFFMWPNTVERLRETRVWQEIRDKIDDGSAEVRGQLGNALQELRRLERRSIDDAITGERHRTLWQDPTSPTHR